MHPQRGEPSNGYVSPPLYIVPGHSATKTAEDFHRQPTIVILNPVAQMV
jgi:hypothetical protein